VCSPRDFFGGEAPPQLFLYSGGGIYRTRPPFPRKKISIPPPKKGVFPFFKGVEKICRPLYNPPIFSPNLFSAGPGNFFGALKFGEGCLKFPRGKCSLNFPGKTLGVV